MTNVQFLKNKSIIISSLDLHTLLCWLLSLKLMNIFNCVHLKNIFQTQIFWTFFVDNFSLSHVFKHLSSLRAQMCTLGRDLSSRHVWKPRRLLLKHKRRIKILSPLLIPSYYALPLTVKCCLKLSPMLAALPLLNGHQAPSILSLRSL